MKDDAKLSAWVNQVADTYEADQDQLWARVRQRQDELQQAGYRTTLLPEHDAANWLLVFDVTDDVDGKRSSKPTWRPRASCDALQATREEVSRFTSGRPA